MVLRLWFFFNFQFQLIQFFFFYFTLMGLNAWIVAKRPISDCSWISCESVFDLILVESDLELNIRCFSSVQFMKRKKSLGDAMKVFVELPSLAEFWFSSGLTRIRIRCFLDSFWCRFTKFWMLFHWKNSRVDWCFPIHPRLSDWLEIGSQSLVAKDKP